MINHFGKINLLSRPLAVEQNKTAPVSKVQFGQKQYQDVFQRVNVNPAQKKVLDAFKALERETKTAADATKHFWVLEDENYDTLTNVKGRDAFHSPFTDAYIKMQSWPERRQLVEGLTSEVKRLATHSATFGGDKTQASQNAFRALTDIYLYALRREGALLTSDNRMKPDWSYQYVEAQRHFASSLTDLFRDQEIATPVKYEFQKQLKEGLNQLEYLQNFTSDRVSNYVIHSTENHFYEGLDMKLAPVSRVKKPSEEQLEKLRKALLWSDSSRLRKLHETGELKEIMPAWEKVIGPDNHQHDTQDFNLLEHTLKTVEATKASPYYVELDRREQRLVAMAALLHDIAKHTAPENLRSVAKIDRIHPFKSMMVAKEQLPDLGFSEKDIEDIEALVLHHQLIGNMMVQTLGRPLKTSMPNRVGVSNAARAIGTTSRLKMLKALTEGDISSVKENRGYFTKEIKEKLEAFSEVIGKEVERLENAKRGGSR